MAETNIGRSGGRILVDQLEIHGAKMAFGVPGESYLPVLDALYDSPLRYVTCRQEGGAAMMAEAYGKLTGEPGICLVTRGPGATNASPGLHIAHQDSTPLILFVGQVERSVVERGAFQEIDYRRAFGQFAKWVAQIDETSRIPEFVSRAFHTATSGRPGPVVLALPEDMLSEICACEDAASYQRVLAHPSAQDMAYLHEGLKRAKRPLFVLGGGGWTGQAVEDFQAFAEASALPVAVSFRRQDRFDNEHPNYVGEFGLAVSPRLRELVRESDLLVLFGTRMGELSTQEYSLLAIPQPRQKLIHVMTGSEELGRVYQADRLIQASPGPFAAALRALQPISDPSWRTLLKDARENYLAHSTPPETLGRLQMGKVMQVLRDKLPPDAILSNGAGNYTVWPNRFYRYRRFPSILGPISGSMGYGTPAAVAAKLVFPERPVVCFAGDGCFLMNGQELATAVHYNLKILFLVVANDMFGTIRMHQERNFPGRVSGTDLVNPDFAALAHAYGAKGERVASDEEFPAAFERCQAHDGPSLIELRIDPEVLTVTQSLSEIRASALNINAVDDPL
jgi:acetolactate synthase-1/2/3 large subunit